MAKHLSRNLTQVRSAHSVADRSPHTLLQVVRAPCAAPAFDLSAAIGLSYTFARCSSIEQLRTSSSRVVVLDGLLHCDYICSLSLARYQRSSSCTQPFCLVLQTSVGYVVRSHTSLCYSLRGALIRVDSVPFM